MNDYFKHLSNIVPKGARAIAAHVNNVATEIETGLDKLPTESEFKQGTINYSSTETGAANAYVITLPYTPVLTENPEVSFVMTNAPTGASTLNANSTGIKALKHTDGSAISLSDFAAGDQIVARYNGTEYRITSSVPAFVAAAAVSAAEASTSETNAATSETNSATSETNASSSASSASSSASSASTSAGNASTDASTATVQAGNASTSATNAATSAASATTSASGASTSASAASGSASAASASETASASSATASADSATAASGSATSAGTSATNSSTSATNALASENKAEDWADEAEDIEVEIGLYSAKHWAAKSQAAQAQALEYQGVWDASGGVYPTLPTNGDMYKVSVAGTISGTVYAVGDTMIYNGTDWDKIDSEETVSSVAGKVGAVTLTVADLTDNSTLIKTTAAQSMAGPLTVTGNINGRDVSVDGTKLDGVEPAATADQSNAEIKIAYEANANTNAFTDADESKLDGIAASANNYLHPNHTGDVSSTGDGVTLIAANAVTLAKMADMATASFIGRVTAATGDPEVLTAAQARSILNVENGATADQSSSEIRTLVEAATDSNVFNDADHTKLNGIETAATADQTNAEIRAAVEAATDSNVFTDSDHTKLNGLGSQTIKLNTKIIEIGDWNMDVTNLISVSHGLTLSTIRSITCLIRNDANTDYFDHSLSTPTDSTNDGVSADTTVIWVSRADGGFFDNAGFDSIAGYNRGWITIQYVD